VLTNDPNDEALLARIEDAGLNASAPPQQRWLDGWLVRTSPGKARRARCVNAVADGRLPLEEKLRLAQAVYAEAGLPMMVRITPFTRPPGLDAWLAGRGWSAADESRVMVCTALPSGEPPPLPAGTCWEPLDAPAFADAVGALRGSPHGHRQAHAQRLAFSPVPTRGFAIRSVADGSVLACGQFAREGELVGIYDVFCHPQARGRGLAGRLCERLLTLASREGAVASYLQVEADNQPARRIYQRLGYADAYKYHYRVAP